MLAEGPNAPAVGPSNVSATVIIRYAQCCSWVTAAVDDLKFGSCDYAVRLCTSRQWLTYECSADANGNCQKTPAHPPISSLKLHDSSLNVFHLRSPAVAYRSGRM